MQLTDILRERDAARITTREAVKLLAQYLTTVELAVAFIECLTQRNRWREMYNAHKETPQWKHP